MSLRGRITLLSAGAVALAIAVAAAIAWLSARNELRGEIDAFLLQRTAPVSAIGPGDFDNELSELAPFRGRGPRRDPGALRLVGSDALVQIIGPRGDTIFVFSEDFVLPVEGRDLAVLAGEDKRALRDVTVAGEDYRMITVPGPGGTAVQVARSLEETNEILSGLALRLTLIGLAGVAVAAALGWVVARRSLVPVDQLSAAAEHVAATQDLTAPIAVERRDEVGRLAESFNTMLAALSDSRDQQHRLVTDAGHELRTPLTALRTNIEVLQRNPDMEPAERARLLTEATTEAEELTALVSELVELATDRRAEEPIEVLRLDELVRAAADRTGRRTARRVVVTTQEVNAEGRKASLDRAVSNLLDNAHKWSPAEAPIEVEVSDGRVAVRDHGSGIPEEDRPHIFDRFYRSTQARTMAGSGLGLAIVKQVVEEHNGEVFVEVPPGDGAVVGFRIPVLGSGVSGDS